MFKNKGIAFKLALFFGLSSSLILLTALGYYFFGSRHIIQEEILDNSKQVASATVNKIDGLLFAVQSVPENFAILLEMQNFSRDEIFQYIKKLVQKNPEIYGMAVAFEPYAYDKKSYYFCPYAFEVDTEIKTTYLGGKQYDYFNMQWYQSPKELGKPIWTEPYIDEGGGTIMMATYSVPFYKTINGNRKFMGVVTADVSVQNLANTVSSVKVLETGYGTLLTKKGTFITHPHSELVMKETIFSIANKRNDPLLYEIGKKAVDGQTGFVRYRNIYNQPSWLYYTSIPSNGWALMLIFPIEELMRDINELNKKVLLAGVLGLALLLASTIIIARSITKPLKKLSQSAEEIGVGNFDIELPPVKSNDEVGRLTKSFHYMKESLKKYIHDLSETTVAKEKIESELKIAHDIQMNILPKTFPPFPNRPDRFDLFALLEPAREVGGDFYDFFFVDDEHFFFVIGDVSGKGVPASLFMAVTKTLLKTKASSELDPAKILTMINKDLSDNNDNCMFVTIFCGVLNINTGRLTYANGGHFLPLFFSADGEFKKLKETDGVIVGAIPDVEFSASEVSLQKGDCIFMFTDGLTEAMNPHNELFSMQRLTESVASAYYLSAQEMVAKVVEDVMFFAEGASQSDDITVMALRFKGEAVDR